MPSPNTDRISPVTVAALSVFALAILVAGIATPAVRRTQEARVLETAREMLETPPGVTSEWLIPRANDEVRLNKPPLAYWVAAGSFKLLAVGEFAGRLPFAVAGWLTLILVYQFGRRLVDQSFGLWSAAILLGSYMFVRHTRLAETDGLAALFLTAAVYWLWRGGTTAGGVGRSAAAYHLAGVAIGLTVMAKGMPAAFAVLFFVAWALVERRPDALRRFLLSGAALTAVAVGGTWFFLIRTAPESDILYREIRVIATGENHGGWFWEYIPQLLLGAAPWTGVFVLGIIFAVRRWRADASARVVLLWAAAILLPLCVAGNKQSHYLVPLAPPVAMLAAYAIRFALRRDDAPHAGTERPRLRLESGVPDSFARQTASEIRGIRGGATVVERPGALPRREREGKWVRRVFAATVGLAAAAPVAAYAAARFERGVLQTVDLALTALVLVSVVGVASVARRQGFAAAAAAFAVASALVMAVLFGRWEPSLDGVTHRTIAADVRGAYGYGRPMVFYGDVKNSSLALVWSLREVVPVLDTEAELRAWLGEAPETVVIAQTKNKRPPPPIPPQLTRDLRWDIGEEGAFFETYVRGGGASTTQQTGSLR